MRVVVVEVVFFVVGERWGSGEAAHTCARSVSMIHGYLENQSHQRLTPK